MGFAEAADLPVVLVGDIDKGGVIAALVGTHALLEPAERARLKGYLINKFRGDPSLFEEAHPIIAARTGMRSYGVVPWFDRAHLLPAEDILGLEDRAAPSTGSDQDRRPSARAHCELRRSRPARGRARRAAADRASRHATARRCRPRPPARLQGDARRSCRSPGAGLGCRYRGARPPRRRGARDLRRLSDAWAARRRSRRHRGAVAAPPRVWDCSISRRYSAGDKQLA